MDFDNQPRPFKIYRNLELVPLPSGLGSSGVPALDCLGASTTPECATPTLLELAGLLHHAAGITKVREVPGGQMYFRAAACTGALYHIEVYLVCGDMPGLPGGVYHFGPQDFSLRRLREGDYRGLLVEASGGEPSVAGAPAVFVLTSVFWRNAWKYQARAYRHAFWDSGTVLANLLSTGSGYRLPIKVISSFVDEPVNRLLNLDDGKEVALQLVTVGMDPEQTIGPVPEVKPMELEVEPYSRREEEYPAMAEAHAASSLATPEQVRELWGKPPSPATPEPQGRLFPLSCPPAEELPQDSIEEVILRRGSSRRFRRSPISYQQLSIMLDRAVRPIPADFIEGTDGKEGSDETLNQIYLIVNGVDDLPSGSYVYRRDLGALEQLSEGDFREQAGRLDLGQELAADASVNIYFLTDLNAVLQRYGNRGYRMAQMEASITAGRLYLAAYAQKLGATGLTFFDDEVTEFFSPHAEGKSVMFLLAVGRSGRRG
jgi:SagB-type dehydrogenase family enzyme